MLNTLSTLDPSKKKYLHENDYFLPYESRSSLKIIKEWKNINHFNSAKMLHSILTLVFIKRRQEFFREFCMLSSLIDVSKLPVEIILIKRFTKLFSYIKGRKRKLIGFGFYKLKDKADLPYFLQNIPYMLRNYAVRRLAIYNSIKIFRKRLQTNRTERKIFQHLKIRSLMGLCENMLTQTNPGRDLFNSFRKWHLSTVIKSLFILNQQMNPLYEEKVFIGLKMIADIFYANFKSVFDEFRTNQFNFWNNRQNISRMTAANQLTMRLLRVFGSKLNQKTWAFTTHKDTIRTFFLYSSFKKLKKTPVDLRRHKNQLKGSYKLFMLLRYSSKKVIGFSFSKLKIALAYDFYPPMDQRKVLAVDSLNAFLKNRARKSKFTSFHSIKLISSVRPKTECNVIEVIRKHSINVSSEQYALSRWRQNAKAIDNRIVKAKIGTLLSVFKNLKNKILSRAFCAISKNRTDVVSLIGGLANYIRECELSISKTNDHISRFKKGSRLVDVMRRNIIRKQANQAIRDRVFNKWQENITFKNSRIRDYAHLLDILESEKDYLNSEIAQNLESYREISSNSPDTRSPSPTKHINHKVRYLEFLEIQNSKLISEIDKVRFIYDKEGKELLAESIAKSKRSYSV